MQQRQLNPGNNTGSLSTYKTGAHLSLDSLPIITMSQVPTKRVHWEDDFDRNCAHHRAPFYVTFLVDPTPPSQGQSLPQSPIPISSPKHRQSPPPRPCLRPPAPFKQPPLHRAPSPFPGPRRHSMLHRADTERTTRTPLSSTTRLSVHRALRLGTCQPLDFFSPSRVVAHPQISYEPASKPAFQKVSILVEIDGVERFNIEIVRKDGILTVEDILTWAQKVLRGRLEPRVMGGCYKEKCRCGCGRYVDKKSDFTTVFDGLSVRGGDGELNKWRMHLRRVKSRV